MTRYSIALALAACIAAPASAQSGDLLAAEFNRSAAAPAVTAVAATAVQRAGSVLDALAAGDRGSLFAAAPAHRAARARADWGQLLDRFEEQGAVSDVRVLDARQRPDGKMAVRARVVFGDTAETLRMVWAADGSLALVARGASDGC